jgi:ribosome recycling factor
MSDFDMKDLRRRMQGAVEVLKTELGGLRTGRASITMLEPVQVNAYGASMPMNQVGSISVPEPRLLSVQVWDASLVKAVEKAVINSGLGLNPMTEGNVIRIAVPELNEERRQELGKVAGKYAEQARVSVRNVRRDGMDMLKRMEKDSEISEDDHKRQADEVQKLTDELIENIDSILSDKEKDIMTI